MVSHCAQDKILISGDHVWRTECSGPRFTSTYRNENSKPFLINFTLINGQKTQNIYLAKESHFYWSVPESIRENTQISIPKPTKQFDAMIISVPVLPYVRLLISRPPYMAKITLRGKFASFVT